MRNQLTLTLAFFFILTSTACLKTRAQLKEDSNDSSNLDAPSKPMKAQVQDVQPEGRYVVDEMKGEITRLNGRIEDLERAQKEAGAGSTAGKDDIKKLETRIIELEHAQADIITQLKKIQDSAPVAESPGTYEKAKKLYSAGIYDEAAENFTSYLKHPKGKNTEDATFLRGECYFGMKQYKKAIVDYSKFPEKYTRSKYLAQALYKIGRSFEALGMNDDAKGFYQELADKFPNSTEAKKIKSKLK